MVYSGGQHWKYYFDNQWHKSLQWLDQNSCRRKSHKLNKFRETTLYYVYILGILMARSEIRGHRAHCPSPAKSSPQQTRSGRRHHYTFWDFTHHISEKRGGSVSALIGLYSFSWIIQLQVGLQQTGSITRLYLSRTSCVRGAKVHRCRTNARLGGLLKPDLCV